MTVAEATCPKCGAARSDAEACARCGLSAAHADSYTAKRDAEVPARMVAVWDDAVARWNEPAAHDAVVAAAADLSCFAWVAARYRERDREGDEIARAQLARIARATEAALTIGSHARRANVPAKTPYRGIQMMVAVLVLAVLGAWLYARLRPTANDDDDDPPPAQHGR